MIKLTKIKSQKNSEINLVFIPGGPGLSSMTLRSMDILTRSFNLYYIDFPGCNGNPYLGKKTFDELAGALSDNLKKINGKIFLVGHSFGGFFAAKVGLDFSCDGIVCLSTPFSGETLNSVTNNYQALKSEKLSIAEQHWSNESNDLTFAKWLSEYGLMYFNNENLDKGKKLIIDDKVSAQFFIDNRSVGRAMELLLPKLKISSLKKLFIVGSNDELVSQGCLKQDALNGGFKFSIINNASHFTTFDQPEAVAGLIEQFIATEKDTL